MDRRRKSTEANLSTSPGRSGPNSTTSGSTLNKCNENMERPKTPSGNAECTTSPDSGIGKDLPPSGMEGWMGSGSERDPLALGALNDHNGSRKRDMLRLHNRSMSKESGFMGDSGK